MYLILKKGRKKYDRYKFFLSEGSSRCRVTGIANGIRARRSGVRIQSEIKKIFLLTKMSRQAAVPGGGGGVRLSGREIDHFV